MRPTAARAERRVAHRLEQASQRGVDPLGDEIDDARREHHLDLDARVGGDELRDDLGDDQHAEIGDRRDAEEAGRLFVALWQVVHRSLERRELGPDARVERSARRAQLDAAGRAVDQADAEIAFERRDRAAHRRLRHPEVERRRGEPAALGDGGEDAKAVEIHRSHGRTVYAN